MCIIFYGAILALLLPVVYWTLIHTDQVQFQICTVRYHGLRGMRPTVPQSGMVKVWGETGGTAATENGKGY